MLVELLLTALQTPVDPYQLEFNTKAKVNVSLNRVTDTSTGKYVTLDDIARAADGKHFVYVGEEHDNPDAHRWQALIIRALHERGRDVIIGLEMYQRPKQQFLDYWTLGRFTEEQFLQESDWKNQWGFAWELYQPIFLYAKEQRLRMVALNVPRDWVRAVSRSGVQALPEEALAQLPELFLGNENHRKLFEALLGGGHPGPSLDGMYRGQVLWDEAMADTMLRYMSERYTTDRTVFVVVAGNGHVMYNQGINYRIERRTQQRGINVVTVSTSTDKPTIRVSADLGDYLIGTRIPERPRR